MVCPKCKNSLEIAKQVLAWDETFMRDSEPNGTMLMIYCMHCHSEAAAVLIAPRERERGVSIWDELTAHEDPTK